MNSPYLTMREAAEFLRYKTVRGFAHAVRKQGIPYVPRDRERLFLKADLISAWNKKAEKGAA